jgi:hypothetical protein
MSCLSVKKKKGRGLRHCAAAPPRPRNLMASEEPRGRDRKAKPELGLGTRSPLPKEGGGPRSACSAFCLTSASAPQASLKTAQPTRTHYAIKQVSRTTTQRTTTQRSALWGTPRSRSCHFQLALARKRKLRGAEILVTGRQQKTNTPKTRSRSGSAVFASNLVFFGKALVATSLSGAAHAKFPF